MIKIFSGIFLIMLFGSQNQERKTFLKTITIGPQSYKIYKLTKYVHDEQRNMDFFVVYDGKNEQNCSAHMLDTANGNVLTRGLYSSNQRFLEFREYYSNNHMYDSVVKRFYPNKYGKLILLRFISYKDGTKEIKKY